MANSLKYSLDGGKNSCSDYGLNAVDLFSWGIFRKYERKDWEWYNIFKEKIKFDGVYLPQNKKERTM